MKSFRRIKNDTLYWLMRQLSRHVHGQVLAFVFSDEANYVVDKTAIPVQVVNRIATHVRALCVACQDKTSVSSEELIAAMQETVKPEATAPVRHGTWRVIDGGDDA